MNDHIVHYVGNRSPSLYGTILIDGEPVDLTGSTVKLQMRAVGSSTLDVDTAAVVVSAAEGTVRYDWASGDVDTVGSYMAWWRVTAGALIQDTPEFLIEIREHAQTGDEYISVGELKETLSLSDTTFADSDLMAAVQAASRDIDARCGSPGVPLFTPGTPGETRKFVSQGGDYVLVDPVTDITAVTANDTALVLDTEYAEFNNPVTVLRPLNGYLFPRQTVNGITVTGTYGYPELPPAVKSAATILAARYLKRTREATFGVVGFNIDGAAVRIAGTDPDVDNLLRPYSRSQMIE